MISFLVGTEPTDRVNNNPLGDGTWYMADNSQTDRPLVEITRDPLEFVTVFDPRSPTVLQRNTYLWAGTGRWNWAPGVPQRMFRIRPR